jgi:hypothetical protein
MQRKRKRGMNQDKRIEIEQKNSRLIDCTIPQNFLITFQNFEILPHHKLIDE